VNRYDAVVIGAGANGLVAALALARGGKRVCVLDRSAVVGGQEQLVDITEGYRAPLSVDAGWMPPAVAKFCEGSLPLVEPAVGVSVAHDGGFVSLPCDVRAAADVIRKYSSRDANQWPSLVTRLQKLAGFLGALYQIPVPDVATTSLGELATLVGVGRKFRALGRADMTELLRVMPMAIQDLLDDELESALLNAAIAAGGIRDLRQGPRSGGTTFNLLHYLIGAPSGSVRARSWSPNSPHETALVAGNRAQSAGVSLQMNTNVARIRIEDDVVTGVVLDSGDELEAPIVISTLDPTRTLLGLVDPVWLDPDFMLAVQNIKYRGSTAIALFALDRLPSAPGLGAKELTSVVSLTSDIDALERAYDAAKYGLVSPDLHIEISAPSVRWPKLAPEGKHVLLAHARYVPHTPKDGPWDANRRCALGDAITARIARSLPGFSDAVVERQILTPVDLEQRFGLTDGSLTHGELTLDQILFMRPIPGRGRHAMPVRGLYLGGPGAHPGPGIVGGAGLLAAQAALSSRTK
jgi:phytoene dehydrogenase-like protein